MTLDCSKVSLKWGSKGSDVTELQKGLKSLGYYSGVIDGSFGSLTDSAVRRFQGATGHSRDGWFGAKTCKSFNEKLQKTTATLATVDLFDCSKTDLKRGSKDTAGVKKLQTMLKALGYYTRQIDGEFGTYTENAVKKFQRDTKHSDDGWFGEKTCKDLNIQYQKKTGAKASTTNTTANNKKVTTTATKKVSTDIIIDAKKYNFLNASEANCTIEGIHFMVTDITDTTSFRVEAWKSIELMGNKFHKYRAHIQPLQYTLTTIISDKEYQKVKKALILIQQKPSCKIVYHNIESGNYYVGITRSHYKINTWKLTFNITEVIA